MIQNYDNIQSSSVAVVELLKPFTSNKYITSRNILLIKTAFSSANMDYLYGNLI